MSTTDNLCRDELAPHDKTDQCGAENMRASATADALMHEAIRRSNYFKLIIDDCQLRSKPEVQQHADKHGKHKTHDRTVRCSSTSNVSCSILCAGFAPTTTEDQQTTYVATPYMSSNLVSLQVSCKKTLCVEPRPLQEGINECNQSSPLSFAIFLHQKTHTLARPVKQILSGSFSLSKDDIRMDSCSLANSSVKRES